METKPALEGIKVLDLTNNTAGPSSAMLLAERGATVVHVEKPVLGDDCRRFAPLLGESSFNYIWANKGKKSLVLDLKNEDDKRVLLNMAKEADVFIESYRPGVAKRLGIDYEAIKAIKPDIVYCSISAFSQKGPYSQRPGYDIIAQGFSGLISKTGYPDRPPLKHGVGLGDLFGGMNAFAHIMLALYKRATTGEGGYVDVSLARGLMWCNEFYDYEVTGRIPQRKGNLDEKLCPYGVFTCPNNEYIVIGALSVNTWKDLCEAMGMPELIDDPRYFDSPHRRERQEEVQDIIEGWLATFPNADEAIKVLEAHKVPNSKVNRSIDLPDDPHVKEVGWIQRVKTSKEAPEGVKDVLIACGLADVSSCPLVIGDAPYLGDSTEELKAKYK